MDQTVVHIRMGDLIRTINNPKSIVHYSTGRVCIIVSDHEEYETHISNVMIYKIKK